MLRRLQRGLEHLYRIDTELAVDDFLIDEPTRARIGPARAPREQLLVAHQDGTLELGLFVDRRALANLEARDPSRRLDDDNLADFLLLIEGVSHFIYLAWRARMDQAVSALELELQAEVDKYVTCLLTLEHTGGAADQLRRRLFEDFELAADLAADERDRYAVANANAHRYSASLEQRFVRPRRLPDMLDELRRFYRLPLVGKLDWIRAA